MPVVPPVKTSQEEGIFTVTLNRPEKRNALNGEMVEALRSALEVAAAQDTVRVVVLTGEGKAFSAGADLAALERLQDASAEENRADSAQLAGLFRAIYRHPKPVIAAVNGHALAGGCGLAAVCDFSIAADHARFGFTEVRIGFVPAIVSVFMVRKLGEAAARDLMLRGHLIDASRAVSIGLINRAVAEANLPEAVTELAREIARETSGVAVSLTKQLLGDVRAMGLEEGLAHAVNLNAMARSTDDCRAGVHAFLAKEKPPWKKA